jgi:hypothetical protein
MRKEYFEACDNKKCKYYNKFELCYCEKYCELFYICKNKINIELYDEYDLQNNLINFNMIK